MEKFMLGKILRTQREQQGITQQALCEGICELSTMSKIEAGRQQPRRATLVALLQRLGLVADRYYGLCNMEELATEDLKLEIKAANARRDHQRALELLDELEAQTDTTENNILRQFVLWTRAGNGRLEDGVAVDYPPPVQREMLTEAIKCTVPRFSQDTIEQLLLSLDEVIILENLANSYSRESDYPQSIAIHEQLLRYVQQHLQAVSEGAHIIPLITYNYSRVLGLMDRHHECLEIAQLGIDCCVAYGKSRTLGELLINKAWALHKLGQPEAGKKEAICGYYVLKAMEMKDDVVITENYLKETYGWQPS